MWANLALNTLFSTIASDIILNSYHDYAPCNHGLPCDRSHCTDSGQRSLSQCRTGDQFWYWPLHWPLVRNCLIPCQFQEKRRVCFSRLPQSLWFRIFHELHMFEYLVWTFRIWSVWLSHRKGILSQSRRGCSRSKSNIGATIVWGLSCAWVVEWYCARLSCSYTGVQS